MVDITFRDITAIHAHFLHTELSNVNFEHANLKYSVFEKSMLENINFNQANLFSSVFKNTSVLLMSETNQELSVHLVELNNGTIIKDRNLLVNGDADCNSSYPMHWTILKGIVNVGALNSFSNNCYFIVRNNESIASIKQTLDISGWDRNRWPKSELLVTAVMSEGVKVLIKSNNTINYLQSNTDQCKNHSKRVFLYEVEIFYMNFWIALQ